jgi:hypothetical protein
MHGFPALAAGMALGALSMLGAQGGASGTGIFLKEGRRS